MKKPFDVCFAIGSYGEFGYKNSLPWGKPFREDMKRFIKVTDGAILICGRKTFESLPKLNRNVDFIVVSKKKKIIKNAKNNYVAIVPNLKSILNMSFDKRMVIIGGASLIESAIVDNLVNKIYLTIVSYKEPEYRNKIFPHDVSFDYPRFIVYNPNFRLLKVETIEKYNKEDEKIVLTFLDYIYCGENNGNL